MNCPYCNSKDIVAVNGCQEPGTLIVKEAQTGGKWITYDEGIIHYTCGNEHHFFGYPEQAAHDSAEQTRVAKTL